MLVARKLYEKQVPGAVGALESKRVELPDGTILPVSRFVVDGRMALPNGARLFTTGDISSKGGDDPDIVVKWRGKNITLSCKPNRHWKCGIEGTKRLWDAGRLLRQSGLRIYKRYFEDFPYREITHVWTDTRGEDDPIYVVQTATKVLTRCLLMTTDPGDLVLDPTCGSGTTAYTAEQWGRRWITSDTSRVAVPLARQRLATATYPYYQLAYPPEGVAGGFKCTEVPHITASSIAHNQNPETERLYDQPVEVKHITRVAGPFSVEAIAALDPAEAMTPAPTVTDAVPAKPADRAQQLFDVLAKDGGLDIPGKGHTKIHALRRLMEVDSLDAEGELTLSNKKLRLAVAFGPYHGPVTANRLEDAINAAKGAGYDALAMAGFSFDPEVSAFLDKNVNLGVQLFRVQIAPDVQLGDLLKVKHAEKLFSVLGQPDFEVKPQGKQYVVTLQGVDIYDPNQRLVKAHQLDEVVAWFLDTDYDRRCFRVRQAFLPAEKGKGFEKLAKALKAIIDEDAWDALKGFSSLPFDLGEHRTVAVKVINVFGHEVVGVRKVKG
jgi:adenine-specific DNA-methyltransferase